MDSKRWNKKAQVTIFIIVAIVIIAVGILIYYFYPKIKSTVSAGEKNPQAYIQECIEKDLRENLALLCSQGGSFVPTNYILYNNSPVDYLCYTNSNDAGFCVVQQPGLQYHIESELKTALDAKLNACVDGMRRNYENRGYEVSVEEGKNMYEILPGKILISVNRKTTITKGEDKQMYDKFVVMLNNNLYELTSISESIIAWESELGDSEATAYMAYYPNIKVEKIATLEGKVYVITDRDTKNKFQFAVRGFIIK